MRILLAAIYPYAFLLLYLIIPFDNYIRALPNILLIILVVAFPLIVKKEDFKKMKSLPIAVFLALFAYLCINSFLGGRFLEDYNIIKKVMIAVGLAILYIPVSEAKPTADEIGKIKGAIILSSLAAIIFSVYNFVLITHNTGSFALGDSPQVVESLLIDRLYLGLLSTFSILVSFQSIKKQYHPNNNYHLANIVINLVFIILIASKIAGISLLVLLLLKQFYGQRKIWKMVLASGAIIAVIGMFFLLKNESDNIYNSDAKANTIVPIIENTRTFELRAIVWQCAAKIIDDEGFSLTGNGFATTNDKLVSCYEAEIPNLEKRDVFIAKEYNTHNQFLDFYLSAGFIALLLFLGFIVVTFLSVRKHFLPTAMLAILVMYCLVENVFHRQIGAYYIGFILIIIMTSVSALENNDIKET
ncbi:O-antigen ligase family protein [Aequorivita viscosa]|uniref:O-antigen ligase n=1 Tax=Aequorivita viscosa TaxID=797419 RepID=A0A1M6C0U3_9FLAO|nr:O-antigen ligase family protein [Aequorivita viscosa]SDW22017.1 O-antigen ligase [Aequorivita viscosa]SHI54318.1 O-antigen ligase [Aequorivita viscosa]